MKLLTTSLPHICNTIHGCFYQGQLILSLSLLLTLRMENMRRGIKVTMKHLNKTFSYISLPHICNTVRENFYQGQQL